MTPGPNQILAIPGTGTLVKVATIASGNTFGARRWTDGKMVAPMLPDSPLFRRHPLTGETFWSRECREVAVESPLGSSGQYAQLPYSEEASESDIKNELRSPSITAEKERYLRVRLWWFWNDPDRDHPGLARRTAEFDDNLRRLLTLLAGDGDEQTKIMMAEAWREMGQHREAMAALSGPFDERFQQVIAAIRSASEQGDIRVRELR